MAPRSPPFHPSVLPSTPFLLTAALPSVINRRRQKMVKRGDRVTIQRGKYKGRVGKVLTVGEQCCMLFLDEDAGGNEKKVVSCVVSARASRPPKKHKPTGALFSAPTSSTVRCCADASPRDIA